MPVSKMPRREAVEASDGAVEDSLFDFGEPEIVPVEISPGKYLTLKEPSAEDLIQISKISLAKGISDIEATLQTICILHYPDEGGRKLTLKEAKRLRPKQLKEIGKAMNELMGIGGEEEGEYDEDGEEE